MTMDVQKMTFAIISVIIGVIVIFTLIGNTSTDITTAASNISGSGLPLASLFGSSGILLLIFMVGVFLAIMAAVFKIGKHK